MQYDFFSCRYYYYYLCQWSVTSFLYVFIVTIIMLFVIIFHHHLYYHYHFFFIVFGHIINSRFLLFIIFTSLSLILWTASRRYQFLAVSGAGSSAQVCGRLLEGLARGGVRMAEDAYLVVAPKLARADLARLQAGFEGRFGCRFRAWVDFHHQ